MSDNAQTAAQVIDALASKLAVPAAHLWAVLIAQTRVNAWMNGAIALFAYVLLAAFAYSARRFWSMAGDGKGGILDDGYTFRRFGLGIATAAAALFTIIATIQVIESLSYLANPEYFALHEVLEAVGR